MFRIEISGTTHRQMMDNVREFLMAGEQQITHTVASQLPLTNLYGQGTDLRVLETLAPTAESEEFIAPPLPPIVQPVFINPPVVEMPKEAAPLPMPPPEEVSVNNATHDARGIPYDARIHSSSRETKKDGSWRLRRGVEPTYVNQIEAQLITQGAPVAVTPPVVPVAPTPMAPVPQQAAAPIAFAPPPVAVAPPPIPTPTSAHTYDSFKASLIPTLAMLVGSGRVTKEYLESLRKYFQVEHLWEVNAEQARLMFDKFCETGLLSKVEV